MLKRVSFISVIDGFTGFYMDYRIYKDCCVTLQPCSILTLFLSFGHVKFFLGLLTLIFIENTPFLFEPNPPPLIRYEKTIMSLIAHLYLQLLL